MVGDTDWGGGGGIVIDPIGWAIEGASAYAGYKSQQETNKMNRQIAREQMRFQERMSNTQYQRAMRDMDRAGLNPMLAYMQGGASSPPGAKYEARSPMGAALEQGLGVRRLRAELANMRESRKQIKSQTALNDMLSAEAGARIEVHSAKAAMDTQSALGIQLENIIRDFDVNLLTTGYGAAMRKLKQIPGIGQFMPAILQLLRGRRK